MFHKRRCFTSYAWRIILSPFLSYPNVITTPGLTSPFSGGYENFHSQYPELCTEVKTIDHSGSETEKRVNSQTETRCHHKPDYDQVWKHPHRASFSPHAQRATAQLKLFLAPSNAHCLSPSEGLVFHIKTPFLYIYFSDLQRCQLVSFGQTAERNSLSSLTFPPSAPLPKSQRKGTL